MENNFYREITDGLQLAMQKYQEENNKNADNITCSDLMFWLIKKVSKEAE